jgi:rhodanese-related sulfurtransferase
MSDETEVDPTRAAELLREGAADALDVREDYEWEAGRIEGARHVPLAQLTAAIGDLDPQRPLVVYCRVGSRSQMAAEALRASGWEAYNLAGGLAAWAEQGLPLEPETGTVAGGRPGPVR